VHGRVLTRHFGLLLAVAWAMAGTPGFAASFDCRKAGTPVEKLVCADPVLGRLDEALDANYQAMLTVDVGRSRQALRSEQLDWLARRNRCKDAQCLLQAYRERVDETCDYGVASGVHPPCSPADDVLAQRAEGQAPAGSCPITERGLVGAWARQSGSGSHDKMAFESEAGSRRFDSWLHRRPDISGGSWSFENCAIRIGHPSLRRLDSTLQVLGYRKGVLSLRDLDSRQPAVYVRMP
jgi:uncharacterized protein